MKRRESGTPTRMEEEFQFRAELERLFSPSLPPSLTFSALLPLGCLTKITPPVLFCAPPPPPRPSAAARLAPPWQAIALTPTVLRPDMGRGGGENSQKSETKKEGEGPRSFPLCFDSPLMAR